MTLNISTHFFHLQTGPVRKPYAPGSVTIIISMCRRLNSGELRPLQSSFPWALLLYPAEDLSPLHPVPITKFLATPQSPQLQRNVTLATSSRTDNLR